MLASRIARASLGLFVCAGLMFGALPIAYAGMQISPLLVSFGPKVRSQQITVRNTGDLPLTIQVRLFDWSQPANAGMVLKPTAVLTASPAIVTLAPGTSQLVRVLRRQDLPSDQEHYFRLLLDELPDASSVSNGAVQMLSRYSIPVFIAPRLAGQPELSAVLLRCSDGENFINVRNAGAIRARLTEWLLLTNAGKASRLLAQGNGLTGYVLAGSELRIALPKNLPAAELQWQVATDREEWRTTLAPPAEAVECAITP